MANRFWVGQTGIWSDNANHWSASDGGAPNASKPTSSDNVYFTANSFNGASQTVTVDEASNCLDIKWTGATNNPTFTMTERLNIYGDIVLIAAMTINSTSISRCRGVGKTLTTNGAIGFGATFYTSGDYTLQDDWDADNKDVSVQSDGSLNTNGHTIICDDFNCVVNGTYILGASTINVASRWNHSNGTITLSAGTSTIKVGGVEFNGNSKTYHNVELNGSAHTITGDNTFAKLSFKPSGAQTITFTDTSTQTMARCERTGTGVITLTGTGAAGWAVIKTGPEAVSLENTVIDYCTATPDNMWFFPRSIDGGNNLNIRYVIPYAGSGWWTLHKTGG